MDSGYVVCDTNIWYHAPGLEAFASDVRLCATLINLLEICRTPRLPDQIDLVRVACRRLVQLNKGICVYNPMKCIAIASNLGVDDGNEAQVRDCMTFIAAIAEGDHIDVEKVGIFRDLVRHERQRIESVTSQLNAMVDDVRALKIRKRDPKRYRDIEATQKLIASLVSVTIEEHVRVDQINWDEAELLLHTMHSLFLEMEVTERRFQPNDIHDLYNLAYVGKSDKYWTFERRWIQTIRGAGMSQYLFSSNAA